AFFEQQVTGLLNFDPQEVREIQKLSADSNNLESLRSGQFGEPLLASARKIYSMSVLVRGVYYDFLAKKAKAQVLHHHIRRDLLENESKKDEGKVYKPTSTEEYLYSILVGSAFRARLLEERVIEWTNLVGKLRDLAQKQNVDLGHKVLDTVALDEAIKIARKVGVNTWDPTVEKWIQVGLEMGVDLGVGTLTSFVLSNPWLGLATGAATGVAMRHPKIQETITEGFRRATVPERTLREMATGGPGRIGRTWSGLVIKKGG
ncbi:MAG: hypothetical protein L0Y56_07990, partial [Nitrospira sp.]|nr:hypothetical protein [Nitrospira sp.]